jgi:hypothetical protein
MEEIDKNNLSVGDTYKTRTGTATVLHIPSDALMAEAEDIRKMQEDNENVFRDFYNHYLAKKAGFREKLAPFWDRISEEAGLDKDQKQDRSIMVDEETRALVQVTPDEQPAVDQSKEGSECCGGGECHS